MASVELGDLCWPTAAGMAPHVLIRPSDHDGTIGWPLRHNFLTNGPCRDHASLGSLRWTIYDVQD